jgi:hypothetical protein
MLSLLIFCQLFGFGVQASSNLGAEQASSFVAYDGLAGDHRTTYSIVFSCVATIISCLWISIRPNIPAPVRQRNARFWRTPLFRQIVLLVITLVFPEYVLACALNQWLGVYKLVKVTGQLVVP